jgi:ribosomal protein S18 acetylase RimI-like enzyme
VDETTNIVVGTMGLRFIKPGVGQLIRFGVRPGFEGKGIGSRLYEDLMAFAKTNQYKEIYLTTESDEEHAKARGMYERRGFKKIGLNDLPKDNEDYFSDDNIKKIEEGKTLIYKLELEKNK